MIKILKPEFTYKDDRGVLLQLVHDGYKQINVIISGANCIRGRHYHKNNTEAFYVISGKLLLRLQKDNVYEEYIFQDGDMFEIQSYIIHEFVFLEETTLISMYSNGVESINGSKDIFQQ